MLPGGDGLEGMPVLCDRFYVVDYWNFPVKMSKTAQYQGHISHMELYTQLDELGPAKRSSTSLLVSSTITEPELPFVLWARWVRRWQKNVDWSWASSDSYAAKKGARLATINSLPSKLMPTLHSAKDLLNFFFMNNHSSIRCSYLTWHLIIQINHWSDRVYHTKWPANESFLNSAHLKRAEVLVSLRIFRSFRYLLSSRVIYWMRFD